MAGEFLPVNLEEIISYFPTATWNRERLEFHVPQTEEELRAAWDVLMDYTSGTVPNSEAALQDLDDFDEVKEWHFSNDDYAVVVLRDNNGNTRGMVALEYVSLNDLVEDECIPDNSNAGFMYQMALDEEGSGDYTNLNLLGFMSSLASRIIEDVAEERENNYTGMVTESREYSVEYDALVGARYFKVVGNEHWRPPATQFDEVDPENRVVTDLVLMGEGFSMNINPSAFAKAYFNQAYWPDKPSEEHEAALETAYGLMEGFFE